MDTVADVERDQDVVEAVAHFPSAKTQIFLWKHKYSRNVINCLANLSRVQILHCKWSSIFQSNWALFVFVSRSWFLTLKVSTILSCEIPYPFLLMQSKISICVKIAFLSREFQDISKYLTQLEHPFESVIQSFQSFGTSFQSKLFMLRLLLKGIYPGNTSTGYTAGSFRRQKRTFARRKIANEFPRRDKDADMEHLIDLSDLHFLQKISKQYTWIVYNKDKCKDKNK